MPNVTKDRVSQSSIIKEFLDKAPADYNFTVAELTRDLRAEDPSITNGAVSGFISKASTRGFLAKTRNASNSAYLFRVKRPISAYPVRSGSASLAPAVAAVTEPVPVTEPSTAIVVRSQQQIVDEIVNLLAQLGAVPPDLSKSTREQLLNELLRRENTK